MSEGFTFEELAQPESYSWDDVSAPDKHPPVTLPNGQVATVRSIGVGDERGEWVIPTIVGGKPVSNQEAIQSWRSGSNQPLGGPFQSVDEANRFAEDFHQKEAKRLGLGDSYSWEDVQPDLNKGLGVANQAIGDIYGALMNPAVAEASQMGRRQIAKAPLIAEKGALEKEGQLARAGIGATDVATGALNTVSSMNPFEIARKVINPYQATLVSPEQAQKVVEFMDPLGPAAEGTARRGLQDFAAENISGLTATDALAAIAAGKISPAIPARYFQSQMIPQSGEAAVRLAQSETPAEAVKAGLETALTVAAPLGIERGLVPRPGPVVPPTMGTALPMPRVVPPWRRPAFQMPDARGFEEAKVEPVPVAPLPIVPESDVAKVVEKAPEVARETITPSEDTPIGKNDAGEQLYERKDGSIYRMRFDRKDRPNGYPDFGGDLAPKAPPVAEHGAPPSAPSAVEAMELGVASEGPKPSVPSPESKTIPFEVDDKLVMRSPNTGDDIVVSYRGKLPNGQAVVWTGRSQFPVPMEWLRREGDKYEPRTETSKPAQAVEAAAENKPGNIVSKPHGEVGGSKTSTYNGYTIESTPKAVQVGYSTPTKLFGKGRQIGGFNVTQPDGYVRHFDTLKDAKSWIDDNPSEPEAIPPVPPVGEPAIVKGSTEEVGNQPSVKQQPHERSIPTNPAELQTPEDFTKGEIQKLAVNDLGDISQRSPKSFAFDLSGWTRESKAEAQGIPNTFTHVPQGTDKFIVEFPAGTRPSEALDSLVQAIKQGDGPGSSWLPIAQSDAIRSALKSNRPVSADAVEQHGIRVPRGYVKEGGIYRRVDRKTEGTGTSKNEPEAGLTPTKVEPSVVPTVEQGKSIPVWKVSYTDLETRAARRPFFNLSVDVEAPTRKEAIEKVQNYHGNRSKYGEFRASKAKEGTPPMSMFRHIPEEPIPQPSPPVAKVEAQPEPTPPAASEPGTTGLPVGAKVISKNPNGTLKVQLEDGSFGTWDGEFMWRGKGSKTDVMPAIETGESEPGTEGKIGQGPGGKTYAPSAKPEATESFEGTSLKNAVAELEAAGVGHDLTPAEEHAMAPLWDKAGDTLAKDADSGKRLADDLVANPERGMTDEQSALLLRHKVKLINELNDAAERSNVGDPESRLAADRDYVSKSNELKSLLDAIKKRGTHWGREGRWRQAMAYEDYSFATQEGLLRAAKGGALLTEGERTKLLSDIEAWKKNAAEQEAHRVKAEAQSRDLAVKLALDAIEKENLKKLVPTFDKRILAAAEKIVVRMETAAKPHADALREMLSRMGTTPDPTVVVHAAYVASARIARAGLDLAKLTDEFIREYGPKIEPMMGAIWDKANEILDAQKIPEKVKVAITKKSEARAPLTEEQRLDLMKARMVRKQADLQERMAKGDFAKKKRPIQPALDPEGAKLMSEGREIENRFEKARRDAELERRSPARKFIDTFIKGTYNLGRAVAVVGHGTVGMITHAGALPYRISSSRIWWRNFGRQFGMWAKPAYHENLIHRLKTDPEYETWLKAGAKINPDRVYEDYAKYGKWLGKFFAGGARGFDSLKLARMELNKAQWEKVSDDIKSDPEQAADARKVIAEINNRATGTSTLFGQVDSLNLSSAAHAVFFAPQLYASRFSRVLLDPIKTVSTFAEWNRATPAERLAATTKLKHAAEFAAIYTGALAINQGALQYFHSNQRVNFTDPSQSDWLKFKAHGKNIVADGGLLDPIRLLGQVVYADLIKHRDPKAIYREGTRFEKAAHDLARYVRGKFNPSLGLVVDSATGADFQGRPLPFSNEKPKFKTQKPYKWGEWLLSHGPIPISIGTRVAFDELQRQGMSKDEAAALLEGAAAVSIGLTGAHESEDYSKKK